jgi:hypothetical protein
MGNIERAFEDVTKVIFGTGLSNLHDYKTWIVQDIEAGVETVKSAVSDKEIPIADVTFFRLMKKNIVDLDESLELGKKALDEEQLDSLNIKNASALLAGIKKTTPQIVYGKNIDSYKCACYGPTQDCYQNAFSWFCKAAAYCFMPRTSEYVFGCSNIIDGNFCIKCYNSAKLARCFEVGDSNNCNDCYFCHNCENLSDCMFCFNIKSKRYAIGNVEVGKALYTVIKQKVLEKIVTELRATKKFSYNLYNIGAT